jgi:hypothetical protein
MSRAQSNSTVTRPSTPSPNSTVKSYLHLTDPIFLQGEWQHSWFDVARQQMLLFKDATFYLWSPCAVDPGPFFFYSDTSWPAQMYLAKISIDSQLLAIQYSKTSIYVLDTIGGKKWRVDIKYFNGNEILPNGIVWSEHGGNSQDLVIVTSRGLELYKVSTARGQCKLSRYLPIKTHFFWYEPNFRVILVAVTTQSYALEMTGFFLRYDMSDMPRLELPPPDRMPSFTLGTGAGPQDVKLLTLYGKLYCAVRYADAGTAADFLSLYQITKTKAERLYHFPLHMSSDVMLSVTDNILCCHCLHFNVTLLLDLKLLPSTSSSSNNFTHSQTAVAASGHTTVAFETDFLCGACTMTVDLHHIKGTTLDDTSSRHSQSPQSTSPLKDSNLERIAGVVGITAAAQSLPRTQSWTGTSTSSQHGEWSDAVGVGGELGLDALNLISQTSFPPVESSTGVNVNTGGFSRSRHNSVSSNSGHMSLPPASPTIQRKNIFSSEEGSTLLHQTSSDSIGKSSLENLTRPMLLSPVKALPETVRHATEPYSGDWQIIFPYWVWIPTTRCLLKIKCNLQAITSSFHEPRRVVNFLSLRGSPVIAPRPTFFADYEDSFEAKKILLTRLLSSIEDHSLSMQWANTLIEEMVHHYATEYHRRNISGNTSISNRVDSLRSIPEDEGLPHEIPVLKSESSTGSNSSTSPVEGKEDGSATPKSRRRLFPSMKTDPLDTNQESLYLQSSPNGVPHRKVSVNTQTITTLHQSRLKEQQEMMKGGSSPQYPSHAPSPIHTPPQLEPCLDVHIFYPELFTIGLRSFGKISTETTSFPLSAPPPLSITRNEEAHLICTQTEIFSFVLLPLALRLVSLYQPDGLPHDRLVHLQHLQHSNIDKLIWYLHSLISSFRSHSIPVIVSLPLLVVQLLCYQKKFLEIAHTIQLQFLNDSPELAFAILEMSDLIEDEYLLSSSSSSEEGIFPSTLNQPKNIISSVVNGNKIHLSTQQKIIQTRELKHSLIAIRQAGLDLLWRTQDKVTVVRWMLSHGIVMDAISLCTKIRGQWRAGLTSVTISGLDFFRSAISELCYIRQIGQLNSTNYTPLKYLGKNSFLRCYPSLRRSQSDVNLLKHSLSPASPSPSPTDVVPLVLLASGEVNTSTELESIRFESFSTEQQGIHLLHAVHKFLNTWDPSLLTIQKVFHFSDCSLTFLL